MKPFVEEANKIILKLMLSEAIDLSIISDKWLVDEELKNKKVKNGKEVIEVRFVCDEGSYVVVCRNRNLTVYAFNVKKDSYDFIIVRLTLLMVKLNEVLKESGINSFAKNEVSVEKYYAGCKVK